MEKRDLVVFLMFFCAIGMLVFIGIFGNFMLRSKGGELLQQNDLFLSASVASSPVQLYGLINRQNPNATISESEFDALVTKYTIVSGLDGHGHDFPGAIVRFRARNATMPVFCYMNTMEIQALAPPFASDTRFSELDRYEDAFFHSTDPASLRVIAHAGENEIWFRQDARSRQISEFYPPLGVTQYRIEHALSATGPWSLLTLLQEDGSFFRFANDSLNTSKWYRVRTRLNDGRIVGYSWARSVENINRALPAAVLSRTNGNFSIICIGDTCPTDASQIILEMDLDNDRRFGESGERQSATGVVPFSRGYVYSGTAPSAIASHNFAYRTVIDGTNEGAPLQGESYTIAGYNNRLRMPIFGSYLIKPDHAIWKEQIHERFGECLAHGYNGANFDFAFDELVSEPWKSSANVSLSEQGEHAQLPAAVHALFFSLKNEYPNAVIIFNGYFVIADVNNYVDYLSVSDGALFEYFGFGYDPATENITFNTGEGVVGIHETYLLDKIAVAIAGGYRENIPARLKSLALYLIIHNNKTYYYYNPAESISQDIPYFPEWNVPLGAPSISPLSDLNDVIVPNTSGLLWKRDFENGVVYFNFDDQNSVSVSESGYHLSVARGYDPILGGNGTVEYRELSNLTLPPGDSAIIVFDLDMQEICGDGICQQAIGEDCARCEIDCGSCSGGNGQGDGGLSGNGNAEGGNNATAQRECAPVWICSQWSRCVDGSQTRACTDSNNCGIDPGMPLTQQECGAVPAQEELDIINQIAQTADVSRSTVLSITAVLTTIILAVIILSLIVRKNVHHTQKPIPIEKHMTR